VLQQQCTEIIDLVARPDTTIFDQALRLTGLDSTLSAGGEYTVLVPTDQALLQYLNDAGLSIEELTTTDLEALFALIASHIITGEALQLDDFVIGGNYVTLNDNKVLNLKSTIEPIVVEADIDGCDAQVHIVDYVVRPQTLVDAPGAPLVTPLPSPLSATQDSLPQVVAPAPEVVAPAPEVVAPAPEVVAPAPEVSATALVPSPESDLIPLVASAPSPETASSQEANNDLIPLQPPTAIPVPAPSPQPPQAIPQPPSCSQSIASAMFSGALGDDINIASTAINVVGLNSALENMYTNQPYTIFVPTDGAFVSSGVDWETLARENPATLAVILNNHIIPGQSLQVQEFVIGAMYPTMNADKLLKLDAPLAPVVVDTITVCNVVFHKVSVVIIPTFIGQLPSASMASQQATTSNNNQASSGSSLQIHDVSVGDNSFNSNSGDWNGNSWSSSSGNVGGGSWDSTNWDFGGFSGSVNSVNLGR
jgi:uncharacterized surface protein with fasciclin (FAS1) repeats